MHWSSDVIWWHAYPLGFCGAVMRPPAPVAEVTHRLGRLENWLDYLVELGVGGLLLGPVFRSSTHGYDTTDHFAIDPRLGDLDDFTRLVDRAHDRGLRVMLDGVFNHVGAQHPLVRRALAEGPDGEFADWFKIDWSNPDTPQPWFFEGNFDLVTFNHTNPAVADYLVEIMNTWLDRGADAWRLDAAYAIDPQTWQSVVPRVRAAHPDVWLMGEMIHGDYADYVANSGLDSITQYELWKAIWSSLESANFFELDWCLTRHNEFLAQFIPFTFIGNHDTTRIATTVGPGQAVLAAVLLFTVAGVPAIYAGDEQGFTGTKYDRPGGDDEVRPEFPEVPEQLSTLGAGMRDEYRKLVALRHQRPWLVTSHTEACELANERYCYSSISADGRQAITVTLDISDPQAPTAEIQEHEEVIYSYRG